MKLFHNDSAHINFFSNFQDISVLFNCLTTIFFKRSINFEIYYYYLFLPYCDFMIFMYFLNIL